MDKRNEPIPCEGTVPRLLDDEEVELAEKGELEGARQAVIGVDLDIPAEPTNIWVVDVPCMLNATMEIGHSNPSALTYRNLGANRDAAREGRYDPLNPSRRFMSK